MNSIWLAFLTGLTTGSISCLAIQGGLLTTSIAGQEKNPYGSKKSLFVLTFLISKITAYTLLGFGLGMLGSSLIISPRLLGFMQILAGIFMIITAARLLNLHPFFRYFTLEPPKWALKIIRNKSKNNSYLSPALIGFLTILIPCGVTQAMMILAASSANVFSGAGIMFAFTLGTSPLFFLAGLTISKALKKRAFVFTASAIIISLGLLSINSGQVLRGSPHTAQNYYKVLSKNANSHSPAITNSRGYQEVSIDVKDTQYIPDASTIKVGVPVKLTINTEKVSGCIRAFTIPSLNISQILPETGSTTIEFTPAKTGLLTYSCSMGMYSGSFSVIN